MTLTVSHGGDQGDMIYSLPLARALASGGQVDFNIYPRFDVRMRQNPKTVENIAPLLEAQPYIRKVTFSQTKEGIPLDRWRNWYRDAKLNIAFSHLRDYGLPFTLAEEPWLTVPNPRKVASVVMARSSRYHNPKFLWRAFLKRHADNCMFVGSGREWIAFRQQFICHIPWTDTKDALELAQVIAGADLFIGNQSLPYAIAEGLKMDSCQETTPVECNCIFPRKNATYSETAWNT